MYKHITVTFPTSDSPPYQTYEATLTHNRYEHEILKVSFWDWGTDYDSIASGSPIKATLSASGKVRDFVGYVSHVTPTVRAGRHVTEVVAVGASYLMKNEGQAVYKDLTADAIVKKIAAKYNFACKAIPHGRVYPQVAQSGHTDWELIVRLAKQCGYTVRVQNTELYFEPLLEDFTSYKAQALTFIRTMADDFINKTTIFDFTPVVGDAVPFEDTMKASISIAGVDNPNLLYMKKVKQTEPRATKSMSKPPVFDSIYTGTVATDDAMATFESEAASLLAKTFPYRATVEVKGDVEARPNYPVYLKGLGTKYDGYWTILGVEHIIEDGLDRNQVYTCILRVGTDSLGAVNPLFDNSGVAGPTPSNIRTIVPGVRQTNVSPSTTLINTTPSLSPQITGSLSVSQTAQVTTSISAPTWKTTTPNLDTITPEITANAITDRVIGKLGAL